MTAPLDPDLTVTTDDVAAMNRATVLRAAVFARIAGAVLVGVGIVGAASWLWATVREQQRAEERYVGTFDGDDDGGLDFVERVDLFVNNAPFLVFASLPVGAGLAMRMLADYSVARTGGSLTGYEAGDELPDEEPFGPIVS